MPVTRFILIPGRLPATARSNHGMPCLASAVPVLNPHLTRIADLCSSKRAADMTGEAGTPAPSMMVSRPSHTGGALSGVLAGTAAHASSLSVLQHGPGSTKPYTRTSKSFRNWGSADASAPFSTNLPSPAWSWITNAGVSCAR